MFERKIYSDIISWHESLKIKKRALIIKGLRQTGKTTMVRKFCEEHYDTGLFIAMLEEGTVDNIINGDLKVYKGAIYENIIADAFNKMHKDLYYFHKQSDLEIDFVTRYNNELTLIEVKSNNGNAKALKEILSNKDKYDISSNFKLVDTNIGTTNGIITIPLYMAFLIK